MYLTWAFYLVAAVAVVLVLAGRWRMHPFAALLAGTAAFALTSGMSVNYIFRAFEIGFGQEIAAVGLAVLAAAILAEVADHLGADGTQPPAAIARRPTMLAFPGLIAGVAASAAAAFALLTPLVKAAGGRTERAPLALGLGLSAGHGLLLPSPVVLASATILAADWRFVAAAGIPTAILAAAAGVLWNRLFPASAPVAAESRTAAAPAGERTGTQALAMLAAATVLLLAMLVVQSLGDIASEPLGGGQDRERLFAYGRPLVLLLVAAALAAAALLAMRAPVGGPSRGWTARVIARAAPLVLLVGAAGGFTKVLQETGIAEMNAERFLAMPLGILVPFLAAATVKTLQGSSLVAAITAAGMVQPMLGLLGLDGAAGAALAALAVGAGAMTVSHVNDGLFWLVADAAGLRAPAAFLRFSLGTLVQGVVAVAILALAAAAIG